MRELKHLLAKEQEALNELVQILREKYGDEIETIKLFGSKSRGDSELDSDLDVFIIFARDVDWKFKDEIYDLIFPINLKYDVFISVRIYSKVRLQEKRVQALPFIQNVQKQGIEIL